MAAVNLRLSALWMVGALFAAACGRSGLPPIPPRTLTSAPSLPPPVAVRELTPSVIEVEPRVLSDGLWVAKLPREGELVSMRLVSYRNDGGDPTDAHLLRVFRSLLAERAPPGVSFSAEATPELLTLGFESTLTAVPSAVETLVAILTEEAVPAAAFKRIHSRELESLVSRETSPFVYLQVILRRSHYGDDHPWARDSETTLRFLRKLDAKTATKRLRRLFSPARSALAVVGPGTSLPSVQDLGAQFRLPTSSTTAIDAVRIPPFAKERRSLHYIPRRHPQALVLLFFAGPGSQSGPDYAAFVVLSEMMNSFRSETNDIFRHEIGASYGFGSIVVPRGAVTELFFGGPVASMEAASLLKFQLDWLRRLGDGLVRGDEARAAAARLVARAAQEQSRVDGLAHALGQALGHARIRCAISTGCSTTVRLGPPPGVEQVTRAEIARVVDKYIDPQRAEAGWVGHRLSLWGLNWRSPIHEYSVEWPDELPTNVP